MSWGDNAMNPLFWMSDGGLTRCGRVAFFALLHVGRAFGVVHIELTSGLKVCCFQSLFLILVLALLVHLISVGCLHLCSACRCCFLRPSARYQPGNVPLN